MQEGTIAGVIIFPTPWPPTTDIILFAQDVDTFRVQLSSDSIGRLILTLSSAQATSRQYTFQEIVIEGSGRAVFIAIWSQGTATLWLNGRELQIDAVAKNGKFVLNTSSELVVKGPLFPNLNPDHGCSEDERFFLATVVDIDQKLVRGSRYDLVRAAGLLRQLLLDPTPLVHEINRDYRLKLQFECIEGLSPLPVGHVARWQNPDPTPFPNAEITVLDLNAFLKLPCLDVSGQTATVRELIKACANAKGGVHLGKSTSSEEEIVLDWDRKTLLLGAKEPSLSAIEGICRVILGGLSPLIVAIIRRCSERTP